jgi:hypothetical protein
MATDFSGVERAPILLPFRPNQWTVVTLCFVAVGDKVIKYEKCCCFLPCRTLSGFATQNVPLLLSRSQSILKAIELETVKIAKARLVVVNYLSSQILPSHTRPTPSHCFPSRSSSSWQVEFAAEKPPTCSQFVRRPSRPATGRLKSHHCPKSNKRGLTVTSTRDGRDQDSD